MDEIRVCSRCGQQKPLAEFARNKHGYTSVCRECAKGKRRETMNARNERSRQDILKDYSPRELWEELYRRGYEGKLYFTETHVIDIAGPQKGGKS